MEHLKTLALVAFWVLLGLVIVWLLAEPEQQRAWFEALVPGVGTGGTEVATPQAPESTRDRPPQPGGLAHGVGGAPCDPRRVANPTRVAAREVYRHTDAQGRAVFSDRQPDAAGASVVGVTASAGTGRFSTNYRYQGGPPNPEFERALASNIDAAMRFLARDLRIPGVEPLHVNLTVIEGTGAFERYRRERVPGLATDSGFYTFAGNEAAVRWQGSARTQAVLRHEVVHLALGNWLGHLPIWLNEGLAELVEDLSFAGSYARTSDPARRLRTVARELRSGRIPPLGSFLRLDRDGWVQIGLPASYDAAWSLVHFLLEDPNSRVVPDLLAALQAHRCRPFDTVAWLDRAYPGGLGALDRDWRRWVNSGEGQILSF